MLQKIEAEANKLETAIRAILSQEKPRNVPLIIPPDLDRFYSRMGYFTHPKTNKPVLKLGKHQYEAWNDQHKSQYRLYLKSQKIGLSMLFLLEDVYIALTSGRGKEILIISQSKEKALDHLQDIRKMLRASPVYRNYLIEDNSSKDLLQDEKTKVETIYIWNPDNPIMPTKIIGLGITSPGSLISYKRVIRAHLSDVTLADMTEERFRESFGGLTSRLANTEGSIVIEAPPRGTTGPVFDIVNSNELKDDEGVAIEIEEGEEVQGNLGYLVRRYTYQVGIDCGLISEGFIQMERKRLGILFGMYYLAQFYSSDLSWFPVDSIKETSSDATEVYGLF